MALPKTLSTSAIRYRLKLRRKPVYQCLAVEDKSYTPARVHLPIHITDSLSSTKSFSLKSDAPVLQSFLPENVITSEDTGIDFDPESLTDGSEKKQNLGNTISKVSDTLAELDALIQDAEKQDMPRITTSTKVTSKVKGDFLLEIKDGRKFGFEGEIRHMTTVQGRLTYKMILTLSKAIRLQAFFQAADTNRGAIADFGVRLMKLNIRTLYSDGRIPEIYTIRMKRTKKGKFSIYKMCGLEIKKTPLLKAENALITISFSPNGW